MHLPRRPKSHQALGEEENQFSPSQEGGAFGEGGFEGGFEQEVSRGSQDSFSQDFSNQEQEAGSSPQFD
jgi:hypothetical protein